ncbi:hypothetical protein [Amycolatopsis camponoti]|uniref:hypothetical protein n=1 Tax=Amycolatopsis camponoti TaxID=2606593 RepID=UPI001E4E0281|nr:hypothetical protein [Amycolatopsis camponoti]
MNRSERAVMTQRPRHPSSVIPPHPPPHYVTAPPAGTADLLAQWMKSKKPTTTTARPDHGSGLRFAFYGRTSTTRHQDRVSSQGWQRDMADEPVGGHGHVVATYFDVGTSRRVPWHQRPQADQLMTETSSPESAIDAIMVGEYERAFTGTQFATLYSWCNRHDIQLWLPETAGPVD